MLEETHEEETYEGWVHDLFCKDANTEYIGDDEQPEQDGEDKKETDASKKIKEHMEHHDHELDRETDHMYIGQSYAHPVEKFMNSNEQYFKKISQQEKLEAYQKWI